jgi:hypothetical protein
MQVQMLCNLAHTYWQDTEEGGGVQPPLRDAEAVTSVLNEALELCLHAEALFRGERWSNPAVLLMTLLDACHCLTAASCDTAEVQARAAAAVERIAREPCRSVGTLAPLSCWTDELQARWDAMQA